MHKHRILGLLITALLSFTNVCMAQEVVSTSALRLYNTELIDLIVVRTDEYGEVVWMNTPELSSTSIDYSDQFYIVFGYSTVLNGRITSNPSDYDYWLVQTDIPFEITVYPNPTNYRLTLVISPLQSGLNMQFVDGLNRTVFSQEITRYNTLISIPSIASGIYYIKVYNQSKLLKTQKICIIQD